MIIFVLAYFRDSPFEGDNEKSKWAYTMVYLMFLPNFVSKNLLSFSCIGLRFILFSFAYLYRITREIFESIPFF